MASYDLDDLDGDAICPSAVLTVYSTCLSRINNTSCRSRGVWYTRSICYRVHLGTQVPNLSELFFFFFFLIRVGAGTGGGQTSSPAGVQLDTPTDMVYHVFF